MKSLTRDIASCQSQIGKLHDFLEQGIYSPEMFEDRYKILSNRLAQYQIQQKTLHKEIEQDRINLTKHLEFIPKVEQALDVYYSLESPAERNDILCEIIDHILYTKEKSGRFDKNNLFDFHLEIIPKIPK